MILVNTEVIPGYRIVRILGLVQGNTVRAKHIGRDIMAGLKNIVGGELVGYTELLTESRREAISRMMAQAQQLGANGILNVRFSTSSITQGAAELYAYGTAVVLEPEAPAQTAAPQQLSVTSRQPVAPPPPSPPSAFGGPPPLPPTGGTNPNPYGSPTDAGFPGNK